MDLEGASVRALSESDRTRELDAVVDVNAEPLTCKEKGTYKSAMKISWREMIGFCSATISSVRRFACH